MKCEDYLTARGVTPETAREYRLEFDDAPDKGRIVDRLGADVSVAGQPLSGYAEELLWIPYLNSDGAISSWSARIFPTPPNGGPKFLTPKNGAGPAYIAPVVWDVANKPDVPVVLTEGPIKTIACLQAGKLAIGLNGVFGFGWRDANDVLGPHPSLATFEWAKRQVFLAFDADLTSKFDVRKALFRTFLLLAAQQADVFTITSWDAGEAKGIDDLLARSEGPAEVLELLIKDCSPFLSVLEKTPADLRLVEEELKAVPLPRLQQTQIIKQVARAVGVTPKDLLAAVTPPKVEPDACREVNLVDETIPWDGPVDGEKLFNEIYALIGEVMWLSPAARLTITFWLIASYTFRLYRKFPYLRIKSADKNCGKSTLVDLLSEIVFNPLIATDVSPAALYRIVESFAPTLLLDEFDNPDQVRELTQLLNAGFDNNRSALRYNMDKDRPERFRTYCPKVLASIKQITTTTESRCLPIDLQRVPADAENSLTELCDIDPERFRILKRKILAWLEDHLQEIKECRPVRPKWLHTRDWDMWRPCYVIAEVLGERGTEMVKQAATGVFGDRVVEQSLAIEILACIRKAIRLPGLVIEAQKGKKSGFFIRTQELVDHCNGYEERPWADWKTGDRAGLTTARFAKELRDHFKLKSEQVWYGHEKKYVYGYWVEPFQKLFDSFLPPEDDEPPPESTPPTKPTDAGIKKEDSVQGGKYPLDDNVSSPNASESGTSSRCHPKIVDNNVASQNRTTTYATGTTSEICPTYVAVQGVFSPAEESTFLAIDVETASRLKWRGSRGKSPPDALDPRKCELRILSAATPDGNVVVHDFRQGPLPDHLRTALATTPLLAHNAAFDLAVLQANGYATCPEVFCTLTASRLLTAGLRDSNDLGAVLKRHLGLEVPKELGASDWGKTVLTGAQLEYCRNDVLHLHRLCEALQAKLANPADGSGDGAEGVNLARVAQLEMSLLPFVADMCVRGIKVDRARLEQAFKAYETRKKQLSGELHADLKAPGLNLASPSQLLGALKELGLDLPNTSKETLSAIPDPIAGRILQYREFAGSCATLKSWLGDLDGDNRLYPPLNPLGADTGRFSCKKPNLLAVPRDSELRGCFIPNDPGLVLIEADFSNIEMRIAAWLAREERMLAVFRNGGDIHSETAGMVLHNRSARQEAKAINFGMIYGGGPERLRITAQTEFGVDFTPEQAKRYYEAFFQTYSALRKRHEAVRVASPGITYGATPFGRRRWADPNDSDWHRFQLAVNFTVQGCGADALKVALSRLHQQFVGSQVRILLPVHDSLLLQSPKADAPEVAEIVCRTMREAFLEILGDDFPVVVEHKISQRWGETATL